MTATRLGITGKLKLTLQSTNPCESMISTVRVIHGNVMNWSSGDMRVRWTAAGMLEAESRRGNELVARRRGTDSLPAKDSCDRFHLDPVDA